MQIVTFNAPIIVSKLEAHQEIKQSVLDAIDQMGRFSYILGGENGQRITHTDWHLSKSWSRPYWQIVGPHIEATNQTVRSRLGYKEEKVEVSNYWFQWYESEDFHALHTHASCMFANVYYVQLNQQNPKTRFVLNKQAFELEVQEGDVITFPSFLAHESPPNSGNEPKVVIAFNTNFIGD